MEVHTIIHEETPVVNATILLRIVTLVIILIKKDGVLIIVMIHGGATCGMTFAPTIQHVVTLTNLKNKFKTGGKNENY